MSTLNITQALENVEMTYGDINNIVNDILNPIFEPINSLVNEVKDRINDYTVEEIRGFIMRIQLRAYEISEIKEKSLLKSSLATAIQKEKLARSFNEADGSAAGKANISLMQASEETVVSVLYESVSNLLKTKVDQLHRLVDALKSVLMSRMQEAKLTMGAIE